MSLSLPATVHRDLQGNVTGNVQGNLTGTINATSILADGVTATTQASSDSSEKVATTAYVKGLDNASDLDITGDTGTGDVNLNTQTLNILGTTNEITTAVVNQTATISLPSSISVDVIGNVTGNLTGNADTATTWETARDLSLTGQATATLSNVDGALAVSGAVTLDNNSVTAKVLTGLPTPSASSVLATDSIIEGIGKLQSQINGLANGLQFQGSWDADTNSPVLSSGGGEATNGTTTSTSTNKLVDSAANFTATVTVGDQVVNQVDGQTALVTNVDSSTILSIDADIMLSGETYTIDNTPFLTQGHYYVVSVGGAHTLNGVSNWSVGDWVIAGANNEWTQLDHTDVEGTGTPTYIPRWTAVGTIGDSIMAESGGNLITVSGTLSTTTNLNSGSNFAVNTDKFTANATTGAVAFEGGLAINTDKFTVNATSGDTAAAGTITATSYIQTDSNLLIKGDIKFRNVADTSWNGGQIGADSNDALRFAVQNAGSSNVQALLIDTSLNSDFAGSITGGTTIGTAKIIMQVDGTLDWGNAKDYGTLTWDTGYAIIAAQASKGLKLRTNDSTDALTIDSSGNSTFAGLVSIGNNTATDFLDWQRDLVIGDGTADAGLTIYHGSGAGNGGFIAFADGNTGTDRYKGYITYSGSDDMKFATDTVVALTIDTSQNATFAGNITTGGQITVPQGYSVNIGTSRIHSAATSYLLGGNVGIGTDSPDAKLEVLADVAKGVLINRTFTTSSQTLANVRAYYSLAITPLRGGTGGLYFSNYDADTPIIQSVNSSDVAQSLLLNPLGGNVGVGTISPIGNLNINGGTGDAAAQDAIETFTRTSSTGNVLAAKIRLVDGSATTHGDLKFQVKTTASSSENDAYYTDAITIKGNNGNVGIGTDSPTDYYSGADNLVVKQASGEGGISIVTANNTTGGLYFADGTTGSEQYKGGIAYTHTTDKLAFLSGGFNYMWLNNDGFLGVGTDNPNVRTEIAASVQGNPVTGGSTQTYGALRIRGNATNVLDIGQQSAAPYGMWMQVGESTSLGVNYPLVINPNGGNVGIGTDSPQSKLHIQTDAAPTDIYLTDGTLGTDNYGGVVRGFSVGGSGGRLQLGTLDNDIYYPALTILQQGGNVGIGTDSPNFKLEVFEDETVASDFITPFSIERGWDSPGGSSTDRITGMVWKDVNTIQAGIYANRTNSGASYGSQLQFYTNSGSSSGTPVTALGTPKMNISSSGAVFMYDIIGFSGTNSDMRYDSASGQVYYLTSSLRYKSDISNLENSLDKINTLRPVRYKDNYTQEYTTGLIAEEVVETIPEVVFKKEIEGFDEPQVEGVNYSDLVPFLIKSIQELKAEVDLLKSNKCNCKN